MTPLPSETTFSGGKGVIVMIDSKIGVIDALYDALSDVAGVAESLSLVAGREDDDHMRMLARVLDGDAGLLREALQWLEGEEE